MPESVKKNFFKENKSGFIFGIIIALLGSASLFFNPSTLILYLIYAAQAITIVIISVIFSTVIERNRKETILESAEEALGIITKKKLLESITESLKNSIEEKYEEISDKSNNLFQIFKLNDGRNFNAAHNIFFRILIESYYTNSEKRKYYIPLNTYYKVIKEIIEMGYKIKTINGLLFPFWYAPKEENDETLSQYMDFCKKKANSYKRVTFYQDNDNDLWKENTVFMIYQDLLSSERSDDVAVRWLITLITKISKLKNEFGVEMEKILGIELPKVPSHLSYHTNQFDAAIKNNIDRVTEFLGKKEFNISNSCKMTNIIKDLFLDDMKGGINKIEGKSIIDVSFKNKFNKNELDIENVTELAYFYKEKENKEYDQFVLLLNGSNSGPSVEIKIITEEDKIIKIQQILDELFLTKEDVNVTAKTKTGAKYRLISGKDVTKEDLKDALLLDSKVYDEIEDGQFNIEKCMAWWNINPDIYFVLRDEESDDLVGYVNLAPITETCYNRIATGTIWDTSIDEESVLPYTHGLYYLNFTSIVIDPKYRSLVAVSQLMNAVESKMIELFEQGIYIKAMIADAVTPLGEKFCRMFNMDLITESNHNSKIYSVSFIPPKFKRNSPLRKVLAEKYEKLDLSGIDEPY